MKLLTNLIEGIQIVKLYGWEDPFFDLIAQERQKEIHKYFKLAGLQISLKVINLGLYGSSVFIPVLLYVYMGNELDTGNIFATMTILNVSNHTIVYIGTLGFRCYFVFTASCQRITSVLTLEEKQGQGLREQGAPKLSVKEATFSWNHRENSLVDVSFRIREGQLLIITGPVGSGKSTLIMGLLREIPLISGSLQIRGTIAFSAQSSWIISGSFKENILMGRPYKENQYYECLKSCALNEDILQLENGDETIVGDRGVTLSGGQKARICLARAIYSESDILILDDPLSAVDAEVSSVLFSTITNLCLRGKIIILVTHQIHTMPYADKVIVLNEGKQLFYGKYDELSRAKGAQELIGEVQSKEKSTEVTGNGVQAEVENKKYPTLKIEEEERARGAIPLSLYWDYVKKGLGSGLMVLLIAGVLIASQASILGVYL